MEPNFPCVWRGVSSDLIGPCAYLWRDIDYLRDKLGDLSSSFHYVEGTDELDYKNKNFEYVGKTFGEVLGYMNQKACSSEDHPGSYYYRATNIARKPTTLDNTLAPVRDDFRVPSELFMSTGEAVVHSTVMRMCSPRLKVWLHYDVCDNLLIQINGRKRVMLFPPTAVDRLQMPWTGSSSDLAGRLISWRQPASSSSVAPEGVDEQTWLERRVIVLHPGDVLRIPALWLHTTEDLQDEVAPAEDVDVQVLEECLERTADVPETTLAPACEHVIGMSINVFYKTPDLMPFYSGKDAWANADYAPFAQGEKQLAKVLQGVNQLPERARVFYLKKLQMRIEEEIKQLASAPDAGENALGSL